MQLSLNVKRLVRKLADARANCPVEIVDGMVSPEVRGRAGHYTTLSGSPIYHPSAYSRRGWSNMRYHCSTIHVAVGKVWLRAHGLIPTLTATPIETRELSVA